MRRGRARARRWRPCGRSRRRGTRCAARRGAWSRRRCNRRRRAFVAAGIDTGGAAVAFNLGTIPFAIRYQTDKVDATKSTDTCRHGSHNLVVLQPKFGEVLQLTGLYGRDHSKDSIVLNIKISQSVGIAKVSGNRPSDLILVEIKKFNRGKVKDAPRECSFKLIL